MAKGVHEREQTHRETAGVETSPVLVRGPDDTFDCPTEPKEDVTVETVGVSQEEAQHGVSGGALALHPSLTVSPRCHWKWLTCLSAHATHEQPWIRTVLPFRNWSSGSPFLFALSLSLS